MKTSYVELGIEIPGRISIQPQEMPDPYTLPMLVAAGQGQFVVNLIVPQVEPARFPWDNDIYGMVLTSQRTAGSIRPVRRFCHPYLFSPVAEYLAKNTGPATQDTIQAVTDWQFQWHSWYDRIYESMLQMVVTMLAGQQQLRPALVRARLQEAITRVLNGSPEAKGMPLTDEVAILRQRYEFEIGYPDFPSDQLAYEMVKEKYLGHVDPKASLFTTGKNHVGQFVMRLRGDEPVSSETGLPMPFYNLAMNPLTGFGDPRRAQRENRAIVDALTLVSPVAPPLKAKGVKTPKAMLDRITTLTVAVADLEGLNTYTAGPAEALAFGVEEGAKSCLDGFLLCPSGKEKLAGYNTQGDMLTAEQYAERKDEIELDPSSQVEMVPELVGFFSEGIPIYTMHYRWFHNKPQEVDHDKVKLLVGGLKGTVRPVEQLYAYINGEEVPVDLVVAEHAAINKGARDLFLYCWASLAGMDEVDPAQPMVDLLEEIQIGLVEKGLDPSGQVMLFRKEEVETPTLEGVVKEEVYVFLNNVTVGYVPAIRAQETAERQSSVKKGVSVNLETLKALRAIECQEIGELPVEYTERTAQRTREIVQCHLECLGEALPA